MAEAIKQTVQWFPGHMAKTRRLIGENMKKVDGVVILLDARIPVSSRNPELDELTRGKRRLFILNKADLADPAVTERWLAALRRNGDNAMSMDCRSGRWQNDFRQEAKRMLAPVIRRNEERGMPGKTVRLMVLGIPNTGKSTFINGLCAKAKAKTEDRAGVTRDTHWYNTGDGVELLDTPGVLWPKFEDPEVGDKLAFTGGVKDQVLDVETLAVRFLDAIAREHPDRLTARYGVTDFESMMPWELLEAIGAKRGMKIRGGDVDTLRCANMLLDEYRAGKLGRISLEMPEKSI